MRSRIFTQSRNGAAGCNVRLPATTIAPMPTRFPTPLPSEITPRATYERRREFLKLMAAGAAAALWQPGDALAQGKLAKLPGAKSAVPGALATDKVTSYKDVTTYNNFYEFGTDKDDPAQHAHTLQHAALDGERRRRGASKPRHLRHRRAAQARAAGGAHLPPALRRGLVDGDPVGRLLAGGADQAASSPPAMRSSSSS